MDAMQQGLVLMCVGLGVVMLFLTLLVFSVRGAAAVIHALEARRKP